MFRLLISSTICFISLFFVAKADAKNYGEPVNVDEAIEISQLLANPSHYASEPATIKGTVIKVCAKRGCWVELAADKKYQSLIIKVADGEMVFPMTAIGKTAFANGYLKAIKLTLEQTKQYLKRQAEAKQQVFDVATVTEAETLYRFTPIGVTIVD